MFSETGILQEVLAVAIAGGALLYLFWRMFGWPGGKKPSSRGPSIVVSKRLSRAMNKATQPQRTDGKNNG